MGVFFYAERKVKDMEEQLSCVADTIFSNMEALFTPADMIRHCKMSAFEYILIYQENNNKKYLSQALWYLNKADLILDELTIKDDAIDSLKEYVNDKIAEYETNKDNSVHDMPDNAGK